MVVELADVVRQHGPAYRAKYGSTMLQSHRRAMEDIELCRTPQNGSIVYLCTSCDAIHHAPRPCNNRSCPKCHFEQTRIWEEKRTAEMLPVTYFHAVFTLPSQLHSLVRSNQKTLYPIVMKSAAEAVLKLAMDPRHLGGLVGILAVLHTWTRTLTYHPHVHLLIPAGAISDGKWVTPRMQKFLLPIKPLGILFKGIFLDKLKEALPGVNIPTQAIRCKWVLYIKPALQGAGKVLQYLARYVHRIAITNSRILSTTTNCVTFKYTDRATGQKRICRLSGEEFLRRYLQHVLPKGTRKIGYYGFWSPRKRKQLRQIQAFLIVSSTLQQEESQPTPKPQKVERKKIPCPNCNQETLVRICTTGRPKCCPQSPRAPPKCKS